MISAFAILAFVASIVAGVSIKYRRFRTLLNRECMVVKSNDIEYYYPEGTRAIVIDIGKNDVRYARRGLYYGIEITLVAPGRWRFADGSEHIIQNWTLRLI